MLIEVINHYQVPFGNMNELLNYANQVQIPAPLNIVPEAPGYKLIISQTKKECYATEVAPKGYYWEPQSGNPIRVPSHILGILYLAELKMFLSPHNGQYFRRIELFRAILFEDPQACLDSFANIPNPASQMATGKTHGELLDRLYNLHKNIINQGWLEELNNCL